MEESKKVFVGRIAEKRLFNDILHSAESEFVVVYGRRCVGKTFLVNSFLGETFAFKLTGLANATKQEQLDNFSASLSRYFNIKKLSVQHTWYEAFEQLRDMLDEKRKKGKKVVFIDELPWLDTHGGKLISALEHFLNDWAASSGA